MIALIKQAIIDYLTDELRDTLSDMKYIVSGPVISQSIPDAKYPFVSVYNENLKVSYQMGVSDPLIELDGIMMLEAYTQSGKSIGEAEDACMRLFLSDDKKKGLIKALQKKIRYTVGSDVFLAIPSKEIELRPGDKTEDNFSYAGRIALKITTKL